MSSGDPGEAFREAIHRAGLLPPEAIEPDGKLHRFASNGKRGDDAGWYVLHGDGIPVGCFGDWRTGCSQTWRADVGRTLTPAEEAAHQRKVDAMRRAREGEEARRHADAAKKARALWAAATSLREPDPNPYLRRKGVQPVQSLREIHAAKLEEILGYRPQSRGEPLVGRCLVVAIEVGDEVSSVELIDETGRKAFLRGGAVAGGYWAAQKLPDGDDQGLTLLIGEGVATVLSAREATGHAVVAALSSANLRAVAKTMRERFPAAALVVLADLVRDTGLPDLHAGEAARAVGGREAVPDFGEDRPTGLKDFNDLVVLRGREATAECIEVAAHAAQETVQSETADAKAECDNAEPGLTDLGNAKRFAREHRENIRYCWPWGKWLVWNGRFWARDETGEVHRLAEATVRAMYEEAARSSPERREVLATWAVKCESHERRAKMLASAQAIAGIPVRPEDLDRDPWLLNVRNGTIDLRTGDLRRHAREDLITRGIDVDYAPAAVCPTWERFIDEVFGNAETIAFVQRAIGYSLTGDVREHAFFIAHGAGSNGKSTLLDAVHGLLGAYAGRVPAELLMARRGEHHPTERATLYGKRFVSSSETGEGRWLAEGLVKSLTGGDPIECRRMREDFWEFTPTHKLWLATNHKPQVRGTDHAIWRRIHLIPFGVTFHEPETGKEPQKDPTLPGRLREELAGILRWAVEGCLAWQRDGLKAPKTVRDATQSYRAEMDTLAAFLEECCVFEKRAEAGAKELYGAYTRWCEAAGEHAETQTSFGTRLRERGLTRRKAHRSTVWRGIGLSAAEGADPAVSFSVSLREKDLLGREAETRPRGPHPPRTCPSCDGEGCDWCGGLGRLVDDRPEETDP